MKKSNQNKLLEINHDFYDQFADSFSATRGRVQPGVYRLINDFDSEAAILDIGCGNGTLACALRTKWFSGRYLGMDMSKELLAQAETLLGEPHSGRYEFRCVDLAQPDWQSTIPNPSYDWLVCFAVLHHLPGQNFRQQTVRAFAELISPESKVAVSVWQWQNSPRLRKRVMPWSAAGLDPEELDPGDVLLDWRAGDTLGLRYVHTFDEAALTSLAESAGFSVAESFLSDGSSGDLALYQIWQLED